MNLSCSSKMIKYLMFAFNLFFVISGIIIIAVGATVKTVYSEYSYFLDSKYFTLPNMLIATGAFIFVVSFFGCCGAIKESWVMLGVFSIFLCIIFVFEFSAGIAGYVLRDKTLEYLDTTLRNNIDNYHNSSGAIWDSIQRGFQCCGVDSYRDWEGKLGDNYSLPISCCPFVSGTSGSFFCNTFDIATSTSPGTTSVITNSTNPPTTSPTTLPPTIEPSTNATTVDPTTVPTTLPPSTNSSSPVTPITTANNTDLTTAAPPTGDPPTGESQKAQRRRRAVGDDASTPVSTTTPSGSSSPPYTTGCKSAFGHYVKKHAVQIGGCALGLAIVQVLAIAFSCHLVRQMKNGYYST